MSVASCGTCISLDAQRGERGGAAIARGVADRVVEAPAVAVHRHQQRPEVADAELPQALGIEVVEVDVLDRLDPGGLERGGAADDREIDAAELAERGERAVAQPALADDDAHAECAHQRVGEALHALDGGGADAHRRVAGREFAPTRRTFFTFGAVWITAWPRRSKRVLRPRSNMWIWVASRMPKSRRCSVTVSSMRRRRIASSLDRRVNS